MWAPCNFNGNCMGINGMACHSFNLVSRFKLLCSWEVCYSYLQLFGIIINIQNLLYSYTISETGNRLFVAHVCMCLYLELTTYLSRYRSAFRVTVVVADISLGLSHVSHQHLFIKLNDCSKLRRLWWIGDTPRGSVDVTRRRYYNYDGFAWKELIIKDSSSRGVSSVGKNYYFIAYD